MMDRIKLLFWIPRVLNISLLFVLLAMSLFSQTFETNPGELSWNFFLFFSPALLMLLVLVVSWKEPLAGGIILPLIAGAMLIFDVTGGTTPNPLSYPILVTGLFYFISYRLGR